MGLRGEDSQRKSFEKDAGFQQKEGVKLLSLFLKKKNLFFFFYNNVFKKKFIWLFMRHVHLWRAGSSSLTGDQTPASCIRSSES